MIFINKIFRFSHNKSGQTAVEYTLILGIAIAVYLALSPMVKRGTQAMVKVVSDEVGNQEFKMNSTANDNSGLIGQEIRSTFDRRQNREEFQYGAGHGVKVGYNETTATSTNSESNLGFSPD